MKLLAGKIADMVYLSEMVGVGHNYVKMPCAD